jgi:parvulin-like peptidyl-prolyl isomerase
VTFARKYYGLSSRDARARRRGVSGNRLPVIILAVKGLLCAILLAGAAALAASETIDRIAATVNDVAIAESEVRKTMVTSALRPEAGESPEAFRARVLAALIDQHLEYEDAQRFGPAPPDATEIAAAMRRLEEGLRAEGKDPDAEFVRAGLTREEVRSSIERQLLIQRYLRERFTPVALADEERAREEYEKSYAAERRAAGLPIPPFESVADEMRKRAQERAFDEEIGKWRRELRQKARIGLYRIPVPLPTGRERVVLSSIPRVTAMPAPTPARTP